MNGHKKIYPIILLMLIGFGIQAQTNLSGNISTITDLPMAGVDIEIIAGETTFRTTTDEAGNYTLENVPTLEGVQIRLTKEDNHVNGVSSLDIVLMSRHILGLAPFNNPNQYIAMDTNKSGSITAFDLIQIRRLILGLETVFPNNEAWRFIEKGRLANLIFNQAGNPEYAGNINDLFSLENGDNNTILNFIAIKVGDANGNAKP